MPSGADVKCRYFKAILKKVFHEKAHKSDFLKRSLKGCILIPAFICYSEFIYLEKLLVFRHEFWDFRLNSSV